MNVGKYVASETFRAGRSIAECFGVSFKDSA